MITIHYGRTDWNTAACGERLHPGNHTADPAAVTCRNCRKTYVWKHPTR